jgi:hypothetical protein
LFKNVLRNVISNDFLIKCVHIVACDRWTNTARARVHVSNQYVGYRSELSDVIEQRIRRQAPWEDQRKLEKAECMAKRTAEHSSVFFPRSAQGDREMRRSAHMN